METGAPNVKNELWTFVQFLFSDICIVYFTKVLQYCGHSHIFVVIVVKVWYFDVVLQL